MLTGSDLTERAWDAFYRLYLGTSDRKWGSAYLTRRFFSMLGERMPDKIVLFMARRGKRLHRRRVQHPGARHDLRPQLGRATANTASCISNAAITRRSSSRSTAG